MSELARLAYLEAMGVESYFPRYRLPAARASQHCPLPVVAEPAAAAATASANDAAQAPVAAPAPRRRPESAVRDLGGLLEETGQRAAPRQPAAKATSAPAATAAADAPTFALRFVHSDCGLLLVDASAQAVAEASLRRFADNLFFALSGRARIALRCAPFRWPMRDNPLLGRDGDAATDMLRATLAAAVEREGPRAVLLAGPVAQSYLSSATEGLAATVVALPGIDELFAQPAGKAELWQRLQGLAVSS